MTLLPRLARAIATLGHEGACANVARERAAARARRLMIDELAARLAESTGRTRR